MRSITITFLRLGDLERARRETAAAESNGDAEQTEGVLWGKSEIYCIRPLISVVVFPCHCGLRARALAPPIRRHDGTLWSGQLGADV
jgi:hypothetical protein